METAARVAQGLGRPFVADAEFEEWRNEDGTRGEEDLTALWLGFYEQQRPLYFLTELLVVLHSLWHIKPRVCRQGVVANPRDT